MRPQSWFLPETPDVYGMLRRQVTVTIEGMDAFAAWAGGDAAAAEDVAAAEERADEAKRDLLNALRAAFVTPLEPEDLFALSRGIDWVLNYCGDLTREARAMDTSPDERLAQMARLLGEAMGHLDRAIAQLESNGEEATRAADEAVATVRRFEQSYYEGMAGLLDLKGRTERIALRELYRGCVRIGKLIVDVSERVAYAVVKQT